MANSTGFLIVGHGLAGSLLSWELIQRHQQVLIVDHDTGKSASRSAAGLVNPITGQRFTIDPRFEIFLSFAKTLYQSLGDFFDTRFFSKTSLLRIFDTEQELTNWQRKNIRSGYIASLPDKFKGTIDHYGLIVPHGGYYQNFCARLDVELLLNNLKTFFESTGSFVRTAFSYNDIVSKGPQFYWHGCKFNHIIFCEGFRAIENPLFSWLPFQPSKGEILTLKTVYTLPEEIIMRGRWLLPLGNGRHQLGATCQWMPIDENPSKTAKIDLLESFKKMFRDPIKFDIDEHKAGIRPNTRDKQPFIGKHPVIPGISIFNGFGSKGVLKIPQYASMFADHLIKHRSLPQEADVARYYATHFPG